MKVTTTNLGNGLKRETTRLSDGHGKSVVYEPGVLFKYGRVKSVTKW